MTIKCNYCPLRRLPIHVPLTAEEVAAMERFKVGELVVDPGTPLLLEGSNSPQLFTALSGQGRRYKMLENGQRQIINFVFPGDLLGLQAAMMSEMGHSVEATTAMVLCVFDRKEFYTFLQSNPQRAYSVAWACAVEEHFLGDSILTLGQRSALESVAWAFAKIWRRLSALDLERDGGVPLPHRQQDLADALGLSLVHTNKTIGHLRDRQIAHWSGGRLSIADWEKLCAIAQVDPRADVPKRPLF